MQIELKRFTSNTKKKVISFETFEHTVVGARWVALGISVTDDLLRLSSTAVPKNVKKKSLVWTKHLQQMRKVRRERTDCVELTGQPSITYM